MSFTSVTGCGDTRLRRCIYIGRHLGFLDLNQDSSSSGCSALLQRLSVEMLSVSN